MFTGVWDCFSSEDVIDIIRYQISLGATLTQACTFICNACVAPSRSFRVGTDNITIVVVAFLQGRTRTEWMEWITERVRTNVGRTPSIIPQIFGTYKPLEHPAELETDFNITIPSPKPPTQ